MIDRISLCLLVFLMGCAQPVEPPPTRREPPKTRAVPQEVPGTQVRMDFTRKAGFYTAPFPSEDMRQAGNRISMRGFPNPDDVGLVKSLLTIIQRDARGFGLTSGVFFQMSRDIKADGLPSLKDSVSANSTVFLMNVQTKERVPVTLKFFIDAGPFGAKRLLSLLPLQGIPLEEGSLYMAVVMRALKDKVGKALGVSLAMSQLAAGVRPAGLSEQAFAEYKKATTALTDAGIKLSDVAGLAVFRTDTPTSSLMRAYQHFQTLPLPKLDVPWKKTEEFKDYCVYESQLSLPVFQEGTPPFQDKQGGGGGWVWDKKGSLVKQGQEKARILVTVPRKSMPSSGYPVVNFVRTGGGGDRPLVERGARAKPGGASIEKGSGPALYFARAGYVGVSIDGPHGGLRNITRGDEQFLIFNIANPVAMRDNIRQSAMELTLLPRLLKSLSLNASSCSGADVPAVKFNLNVLVLMGHSMGATIAPLTLAVEPAYKAAILSGAGGSWIENIVHKKKPLDVRPLAEAILLYPRYKRKLHAHDPALTLLQWGGEPADPPVYASRIVHQTTDSEPRHVLMLQGIVDSYILPPIANALSLSLGLDLAGPSLDKEEPRLAKFTPLQGMLPYVKRKQITLPVQGNVTWQKKLFTAVVTQHKQDSVEDGHEVAFQTEGPKHQYRCFLESLAKGKTPKIPIAGKQWDSCSD